MGVPIGNNVIFDEKDGMMVLTIDPDDRIGQCVASTNGIAELPNGMRLILWLKDPEE